jgi:hypothetical protein
MTAIPVYSYLRFGAHIGQKQKSEMPQKERISLLIVTSDLPESTLARHDSHVLFIDIGFG